MNDDARRPPFGPPRFGNPYVLPVVVGVVQVVGTYFASHNEQTGGRAFDGLAVLLLAAGPAALIFRRHYPAPVLFAALATTVTYFLMDYPRGPVFFALIVAFVNAVMAEKRPAAITALVVGYVAIVWGKYLIGAESAPELPVALGVAAWLLVLLTVTEFARGRKERAWAAARSREEEARRRASEERLRIARELHDVLAHNISLINVQAGVALHLIDERPEQARSALGAIKEASNEALGELRSVLDVLRSGNEQPPRTPTSGLEHLRDLIAKTEAAGLRVATRIEGDARPLPPGVDRAAYRIVQEALTNVTRHANSARATVVISYGDDQFSVQIDDDGRGVDAGQLSNGGRGISGMRERVAALHGELDAGPRPGGGFRVWARFPLQLNNDRDPE
jgi:signal transduction histidine kinase